MLLFIGSINEIIEKLKEKYKVVAFADDILIICDSGQEN
jgi:hypothetical protein